MELKKWKTSEVFNQKCLSLGIISPLPLAKMPTCFKSTLKTNNSATWFSWKPAQLNVMNLCYKNHLWICKGFTEFWTLLISSPLVSEDLFHDTSVHPVKSTTESDTKATSNCQKILIVSCAHKAAPHLFVDGQSWTAELSHNLTPSWCSMKFDNLIMTNHRCYDYHYHPWLRNSRQLNYINQKSYDFQSTIDTVESTVTLCYDRLSLLTRRTLAGFVEGINSALLVDVLFWWGWLCSTPGQSEQNVHWFIDLSFQKG